VSGNSDVYAILLVVLAFGGFIFVAGITSTQTKIETSAGLTCSCSSVEWGSQLHPGDVVVKSVELSNVLSEDLRLQMSTEALPSYLTLTWNCTDVTLKSHESVTATFTLQISYSAVEGKFKFNIQILGSSNA